MRSSVFSTILGYFRDVLAGIRSIGGSCMTAIPYLFGVGELRKEVTEQYPDPISSRTADDLPPRTRGLLFNDIEKCTGCKECVVTCPTRCIRIETEPGADASKVWVSTFDIDFARCVFCGLCVEVCLPESLVHTKNYENSVYELSRLVTGFGRGHITHDQREKWAVLRQQKENDEIPL